MKSLKIIILFLILAAALSACSGKSIEGTILPYHEHPAGNRQVALCKVETDYGYVEIPINCELQGITATSDENGEFTLRNVPEGSYLVLYDAGLGDFEAGMSKYAEQTVKIGDTDWIYDEFGDEFGVQIPLFAETEQFVEINSFETYQSYAISMLMVKGSPFVVAHDTPAAISDGALIVTLLDTDEEDPLVFPALYLGE